MGERVSGLAVAEGWLGQMGRKGKKWIFPFMIKEIKGEFKRDLRGFQKGLEGNLLRLCALQLQTELKT